MTMRRLIAAALATLAMGSAVQAEDLLIDQATDLYGGQSFSVEGFYAGATLGLGNAGAAGRFGSVGIVAGTNYTVGDAIIAGVEFQGDAVWDAAGGGGINALLLARLGGYLGPETLAYAAAGSGTLNGTGSYALGGGIEQALADTVAVRGELLGTGAFGGSFDGAKGAVGLLWHMN